MRYQKYCRLAPPWVSILTDRYSANASGALYMHLLFFCGIFRNSGCHHGSPLPQMKPSVSHAER